LITRSRFPLQGSQVVKQHDVPDIEIWELFTHRGVAHLLLNISVIYKTSTFDA